MKIELLKGLGPKNAVFINNKDIFYLTGFSFGGFWVVVAAGAPVIITSKMMFAQCKAAFSPFKIPVVESAGFAVTLADICKEKNITEIETSESITLAEFNIIKDVLGAKGVLLKVSDMLKPYRYVKTAEEISALKEACRITSAVYDEIRQEIKSGLTELDVHYKILEKFARYHVSESFSPIVASGKNAADPHHESSSKIINQDECVLIDMGCKYKGYCADLTRTFFLGKISFEYQQVFDIVLSAQKGALKAVKAGVNASAVDSAARDIITAAGYGSNFIHTTGHGVGLDIHEAPVIGQKSREILKAGCVITAEPGVYLQGKFGVRIEDTVLVTDSGYEVLTQSGKV
jgi:Xaa-Pro aminopeptidase